MYAVYQIPGYWRNQSHMQFIKILQIPCLSLNKLNLAFGIWNTTEKCEYIMYPPPLPVPPTTSPLPPPPPQLPSPINLGVNVIL